MAQVLEGGSLMFDSLAYGRPHPGTQQFLSASLDRATNYLTTAGQQFMAGVHELHDRLSGSTAARMLRAAGRSIRSMWQLDEVRPLISVGEFQHAPPTMQRWVMADPMLRAMYIDQRVDGYSESYVDVDPGKLGPDHYDYRRATDGLIFDNPDDDGWTATTYFEELLPEDVELTLEEQVDIQQTWAWMRDVLRQGREDPTSRFNADLN